MTKLQGLLIFIGIILLTSCISTSELYKSPDYEIAPFSIENLNGNYSLKDGDSSSIKGLWETLYDCKSFKRDTTLITNNTIINLKYDGQNTLTVTAITNTNVLNKIELKGARYKEYFSINRNLILIPIPFIYFRHSERKVFIGNSTNGNLIVNAGLEEFLWILIMANGFDGISNEEYKKIDVGDAKN